MVMRVLQFFAGVFLQFARDVHVFSAFQHLGVNNVGDNRLEFTRQISVQTLDKIFARPGVSGARFLVSGGHSESS